MSWPQPKTPIVLPSAFKVKKAWRVDKVQLFIFPFHRGHRRRNRGLAFYFLRIKIANCISVGNLTQSIGSTGKIQHRFNNRGLTRPAMARQGDIQNIFCVVLFHVL